jgi:glyoxylase-like metal-dependent hydrolase (beta-lactamase superfamily II)
MVVLERGWLSSNNIVFLGEGTASIVDTGYATHAEQTLALVEATLAGRTLQNIVNSHLHSDHCGGNAKLQHHYPECLTHIPPGLHDAVLNWDEIDLSYEPTGQQCPVFSYQQLLQPGSSIALEAHHLETHAAPGHDPHAVLLFDREYGVLLSADALWENGFGVVFPELEGKNAFHEVRETLELIEDLPVNIVVPGHGRAFADVKTSLQSARHRLNKFEKDPRYHARYAAKVLLKFKLLEQRQIDLVTLTTWINQTSYFSLLHQQFFSSTSSALWVDDLLNDLSKSGAIKIEHDQVFDQ